MLASWVAVASLESSFPDFDKEQVTNHGGPLGSTQRTTPVQQTHFARFFSREISDVVFSVFRRSP